MRPDTLRVLIKTRPGYAWALKMFVIVSLIAGLGLWFGLGMLMAQPTLVEEIDALAGGASSVEGAVQGALSDLLSGDVAAAPARLLAGVQAQAAPFFSQLQGAAGGLIAGAPALPEGSAAERARATALQRLRPLAQGIGASDSQLADILAKVNLDPERAVALLARVRLDPAQLGERLAALQISAAEVDALVTAVRTAAVNAQPVLGPRPSRVIRLGGEWLASPLTIAANWLFIVLALLLVARSLGGRGSIREHLTAALLATAPGILMIGLFVPAVAGAMGIPMALALHLFTRLVALVGLIWALLLMMRTMATAHDFSNWRAIGAMALTAISLVVVVPLMLTVAGGFLLAF